MFFFFAADLFVSASLLAAHLPLSVSMYCIEVDADRFIGRPARHQTR